jgi:hypothetical protein
LFWFILSCLLIVFLSGCGKKTGGGAATGSPFGDPDHPNWSHQIVDRQNGTGSNTSIALDSNGIPHISYLDTINHDLKYATVGGETWLITTVDSEDRVEASTSIAVDSVDQPHIGYAVLTWKKRNIVSIRQTINLEHGLVKTIV